jgi:predicted DNA-binding transcriptional regulator YafY
MNRTERFYRIQTLLAQRRAVPREVFLEDMEISLATFKRDLEYLRDRMSMPLIWDRELGGYRLDEADPAHATFQLPGLWFSSEEIYALLTMEQLLETLQPGLLGSQVKPLRNRIRQILAEGDRSPEELTRRIKVLSQGARPVEPRHFQTCATALLSRRRLRLEHHRRQQGETLTRDVSPQRMVHYRDNWYLDAWCHLRKALRTFSVDAIESAVVLNKPAMDIKEETLDEVLGAGFGIVSGAETQVAVLRFNPKRARWVSREQWHPDQEGDVELDGYYVLKVPYSDARELAMDIMKYGPDVEVLAPEALRGQVAALLRQAADRYLD